MLFSTHTMRKIFVLMLVLSLFLAACQAQGTPVSTSPESETPLADTPAPATASATPAQGKTIVVLGGDLPDDPVPTWTKAAAQTQTAIAEATPTMTPPGVVADSKQVYQVFQGGYGLELSLNDFHVSVRGPLTWVRSREIPVNTMVIGNISKYEVVGLDELRPQVFGSLFGSDAKIQEEEPETFELDGITGIAVNYVAQFQQTNAKGRMVLLKPTEKRYVAVIGMADPADPKGDQWLTHGVEFFEETLKGLSVLDEATLETYNLCPMSEDESYGFSEDNPIRVGGEAWQGPARARAYLDNLQDSQGNWLVYERVGSIEHGGTILDAYVLTLDGKEVKLYVDQYSYEELLTPVGFTCRGAFPLVAP